MANKVRALQQWCAQQCSGYREVNITNMTSSWKSGLAFCALIHRHRPDLIDYDSLKKENVFENNQLAFDVALNKLGIPALLDAEDMVAMAVPDKLCIVTYVSQYYNYFSKHKPASSGQRATKRPSTEPQVATNVAIKSVSKETVKIPADSKNTAPPQRVGTFSDCCDICHEKVFVMERFIRGSTLYHRRCYRHLQRRESRRSHASTTSDDDAENMTSPRPTHVVSNNKKPMATPQFMVKTAPSIAASRSSILSNTTTLAKSTLKSSSAQNSPFTHKDNAASKHSYTPVTTHVPVKFVTPRSAPTATTALATADSSGPRSKADSRLQSVSAAEFLKQILPSSSSHSTTVTNKDVTTMSSPCRSVTSTVTTPRPVTRPTASIVTPRPLSAVTSAGPKLTAPGSPSKPPRTRVHAKKPILKTPSEEKLDSIDLPAQPQEVTSPDKAAYNAFNLQDTIRLSKAKQERSALRKELFNEPQKEAKPAWMEEALRRRSANADGFRDPELHRQTPGLTPPHSTSNKVDNKQQLKPQNHNRTSQFFQIRNPDSKGVDPEEDEGEIPPPLPSKPPPPPYSPPNSHVRSQGNQASSYAPHDHPPPPYSREVANRPITTAKTPSPKARLSRQAPLPVLKDSSPPGNDNACDSPSLSNAVPRRVNAEARLSPATIERRLDQLDKRLRAMEEDGSLLEARIRNQGDEMEDDDLMILWFELINQKNELVRKESELMYRQRQQLLEDEHTDLEFQIRRLLTIPENERTEAQTARETQLLDQLVFVVRQRNSIVDSIEEDRLRYLKEDADICAAMHQKGFSKEHFGRNNESLDASSNAESRTKNKRKKKKKKK